MSDSIAQSVKRQAGALRDSYPDVQTMVVLTDHQNNTYDVQRPGWGGSRKLTRITNVNPDIVGQISVDDTVLVGYYNGNSQQAAILSKAGFVSSPSVTDSTPVYGNYPLGLPCQTLAWPEQGQDPQRRRSTGHFSGRWSYNGTSYPVASCDVATPPRVIKNCAIMVVSGNDDDALISDRVEIIESRFTALGGRTNHPWFLRIARVDIYGSPPASEPTRDGDPSNLEDNLQIYDLEMDDAYSSAIDAGITQLAGDWHRVVPTEVTVRDFYPVDGNTQAAQERCQVLVSWVAPEDQTTDQLGNRFACPSVSEPTILKDGSEGRFFLTLHHVNTRREYKQGAFSDYVEIVSHPSLSSDAVFEHIDAIPGELEVVDNPCQQTVRMWELPYCPISSPIWLNETGYLTGVIWVLCGQTTTELATGLVPARIEKLYWVCLDVESGDIISSNEMTLDAPSPGWINEEDLSGFYQQRPPGGIPWFEAGVYGEDYNNGWGLVQGLGHYQNCMVFSLPAGDNGEQVLAVPQLSYSSQILAWRLDAAGVSVEWVRQGWLGWPAVFQVFSTCGTLSVEGAPKLMIHFEEFTQQSATGCFQVGQDLSGHLFYEGIVTSPELGELYFTEADWPESGYTYAYETDSGTGQLTEGPDSTTELQRIFDWRNTYWLGRNDTDGWYNIDTEQLPESHRHGLSVIDALTGDSEFSDLLDWEEDTIAVQSGDLNVEYALSAFVPGDEAVLGTGADPRDVTDANGPVFDRDDTVIGGAAGTDEFGCEGDFAGILLQSKTFSVRYEVASHTPSVTYENGFFDYLNSLPSQDTGEPFHLSGSAYVHIDLGTYNVGGEESWGDFDGITWGRRFVRTRMWVGVSVYPYYRSKQTPHLSQLRTATNGVRCYFLARYFENQLQSLFTAATTDGILGPQSLPVNVYDNTITTVYSNQVWSESVVTGSVGGLDCYSSRWLGASDPTLHGLTVSGDDAAVWFGTSDAGNLVRATPDLVTDGLFYSAGGADWGELQGGLDDFVIHCPNDLLTSPEPGVYESLSDSYAFTTGGTNGGANTRVIMHHLPPA